LKSNDKENAVVLLLDPRGIVFKGGADVVSRQDLYRRQLKLQSKNLKMRYVIFSSGKHVKNHDKFEYLDILQISMPTFNSFLFAKESYNYIKVHNLRVELLVTGDPWESYWSAYFLNKFLNKKIPIQIQVHGDIADPKWQRINFRNRIRYSFAKLSLPKASSVRAVTKYQAENLVKAFGIKRERIVVVPVPVNVSSMPVASKTDRPKIIGLI